MLIRGAFYWPSIIMYQAVPLHTNPINIIYQPILPYTDLVPPNANQYSLILTQHRQLLTCTAFYWPSIIMYQPVPLHTDPVPPSTNHYHPYWPSTTSTMICPIIRCTLVQFLWCFWWLPYSPPPFWPLFIHKVTYLSFQCWTHVWSSIQSSIFCATGALGVCGVRNNILYFILPICP